ncbi:MAG TPA: hypothetical protein VD994_20955 [Prosthecobacter sp.]|nr:hypothetical protein [Prosthecobacter sp.]
MVNDWGRQQWPEWEKPWAPMPYDPVKKKAEEDAQKMREFLELLEKAKKVDEVAGLPNCEDPAKAAFEQAVVQRLAAIEKMLKSLAPKKRKKKKKAGKRR